MRACSHCRKLLAASDEVCPDDSAEATEVKFQPLAPQLAARFRGAEPFACGATGELWRVVQVQSGAAGLLKVFADVVAGTLAERTRCKRELRKQATVAQGNLPRVLDDGEAGGRLWLLREFISGESLAVRLRRQGALPVGEALAVTAQLAQALDELHRQGLVHRDVKPGHALLTARADGLPIVRLIDAGIAARLPGDSLLPSFGTAAYAAPEIALGKQASFRSDLYSLGCMLYEMLSGAPPFAGNSVEEVLTAQCEAEPPALDVELPKSVAALLAALLAKEPRRRPFSAQQVRRALDPHLPSGMPQIEPAVRSVAPPPSAASAPAVRSRVQTLAGPDSTQEFAIEEIELALAEAPSPSTQELELSDLELQPVATKTQELEVADLESLRPNVKTQELELSDILSVRAQAAAQASAPPAQMGDTAMVNESSESIEVNDADATIAMRSSPPEASEEPAAEEAAPEAQPSAAKPEGGSAALRKRLSAATKLRDSDRAPAAKAPAEASPPEVAAPSVQASHASELAHASRSSHASELANASRSSDLEVRRELAIDALDSVPGEEPPKATSYTPIPSVPPSVLSKPPEADLRDSERPAGLPPRNRARVLLMAAGALLLIAFTIGVIRRRPERVETKPAAAQSPSVAVNVAPADPAPLPPSAASEPATQPAQPSAANEPSAAQPTAENAPSAAPPSAAPEPGAAKAPSDVQPSAPPTAADNNAAPSADEPSTQTVSAVEAGRPFMHDASVSELGGVVSYKARKLQDVDFKGKARQFYQAGKFREAADSYQRAATKSPSDPAAFAGLGASWLAAGEPDKAIVAYQRAVQLKPEVSGFQAALGRAYLTKGDRGRAQAAYSKALALDPQNQAAKTGLASLKP